LGDGERQREQLAVGGEGVAEVGRETPRTLLEVEARPEEDRRWRSMAVSSWRKKWSGMELYPAMWSTAQAQRCCYTFNGRRRCGSSALTATEVDGGGTQQRAERWVEESRAEQRWAIDVSYAALQAHGMVNVALHREYSPGIIFIFSQGRKYLYHV
jgi:hypothetical protein